MLKLSWIWTPTKLERAPSFVMLSSLRHVLYLDPALYQYLHLLGKPVKEGIAEFKTRKHIRREGIWDTVGPTSRVVSLQDRMVK